MICTFFFLVFSIGLVQAQVTYDGNGTSSTGTISLTVPAGNYRLLVIHVGSFGSTPSASFNGNAMTVASTRRADNWVGRSSILVLPLGCGGAITANVNLTTGDGGGGGDGRSRGVGGPARIYWAGSFQNVNQGTPVADEGTALIAGGTATSTITLTTTAGDILFDGIVVGNGGAAAPPPTTGDMGSVVLYNSQFSGTTQASAAKYRPAMGGSESVSWEVATGFDKPHTAIVINGGGGAPVSCSDVTVNLDANGNGSVTGSDIAGNFPGTITLSQSGFNCGDIGDNTVTLSATDNCGNTSSCTATVTVEDNLPPNASCFERTLNLGADGTVIAPASGFDNLSSDNCDQELSFSLSPSMFDCEDIGDNTVILTVTDDHNNSSTCSTTLTIRDVQAPVAMCQDVTVQLDANGDGSTSAAAVDNGSSDNCELTLTLSQTNFNCNNLGPNEVTLTVTDDGGNTASCTAIVTVEDNISPNAFCFERTLNLGPDGTVTAPAFGFNNLSTDNCGAENLNFSVDPSMFNCEDIGENTVTLTVSDASGNTATCVTNLTIRDVTGPVLLCPDTVMINLPPAQCDTAAKLDIPPITDNCEVASVQWRYRGVDEQGAPLAGADGEWTPLMDTAMRTTLFDFGIYEVVWKATDHLGNVDSCNTYLLINPFQDEICANGLDDNCDGIIDDVGPGGYCCSFGTNTDYLYINGVYIIGSLGNLSGDDGGYGDYRHLTANLPPGDRFHIYLSPFNAFNGLYNYWQVWIDWDQSGTFDFYELVIAQTTNAGFYKTVFIPSGFSGDVRMRVQVQLFGYGSSCGSFDYGEVEDYVLTRNQAQLLVAPPDLDLQSPQPLEVKAYPNPVNEELTIELDGLQSDLPFQLQTVDLVGREIHTRAFDSPGQTAVTASLDTRAWPSGTYLIRMSQGDRVQFARVVKQ